MISRNIKYLGLITIVLGLVLNEYFLISIFSIDGNIDNQTSRIIIWINQIFLIGIGVFAIRGNDYLQKLIINYKDIENFVKEKWYLVSSIIILTVYFLIVYHEGKLTVIGQWDNLDGFVPHAKLLADSNYLFSGPFYFFWKSKY